MKRQTAMKWLRENNYPDVADLLDQFNDFNKKRGSKERRNYWDLLVGRKDGECITRNGFTFPILRSVRQARRPDFPKSNGALKRNETEQIPSPLQQGRWNKG